MGWKVEININPEFAERFALKIRIPDWAVNEAIPGGLYKFADEIMNRSPLRLMTLIISLKCRTVMLLLHENGMKGDKVDIDFPMPVRKVIADERVKDDNGKIAFQRGPVIYCAEWPDNDDGNVLDFVVSKDAPVTTEFVPSILNGTQIIKTTGYQTKKEY